MPKKTRICWVLSEDKAGMVAQAQGLAEAVRAKMHGAGQELEIRLCLIQRKKPWQWLPAKWWPRGVLGVRLPKGFSLDVTLPDLIISCGRQSVWPNAEIRRRAQGAGHACFSIHIQDPKIPFKHFDMVTTPQHDRLNGEGLVETIGSLGRTSRETLDKAAGEWMQRLESLPRPWITVSIGGDNKVYHYKEEDIRKVGAQLSSLATKSGGSLLISSSRRTNPKNTDILKKAVNTCSHLYWDGKGDNPYLGFLGVADYVVVSCDSVNMVSEACTTGKPVYVIHTEPSRKTKFTFFHNMLEEKGIARPLEERLDDWTYKPLNETAEVASQLLEKTGWMASH